MKNKGVALFVMPRSSRDWKGAEGLWITTAGWAAAAKRKFDNAYVLTTDRIASPDEAVKYPITEDKAGTAKPPVKKLSSFVPNTIINLMKDFLLWKSSKNKQSFNYVIPDVENGVSLVWEQHDLFPGNGYEMAKKYNAPFAIYVHAPQVWESQKWGVKRPIWGKMLEKMEAKSLQRADHIACVSQQVADKLEEMGIPKEKILVSPMAMDPYLYTDLNVEDIQQEYKLKEKFVIGWTGSFRSFHGVDLLVKAFKKVHDKIPNAHLLLVGDGKQIEEIQELTRDLGLADAVSFPGRMSFERMTKFVNTFDLAVLSASKSSDFHYSPMKLREYLKAGKPTLAPRAGEIPNIFTDDVHLKLYSVGDVEETAQHIIDLYNNPEKRKDLGEKGKEFIVKNGTWDVELEKLMSKIG